MKPFLCLFYDDNILYRMIVTAESLEKVFEYMSEKYKGKILYIEEIIKREAFTISSKKSYKEFSEN